jgi:hypothetical protein
MIEAHLQAKIRKLVAPDFEALRRKRYLAGRVACLKVLNEAIANEVAIAHLQAVSRVKLKTF